ncbi:MAG: hypothetical protein ACJ8DD_16600, partial [Microvirga sp.]
AYGTSRGLLVSIQTIGKKGLFRSETLLVITGLVPVIPIGEAPRCSDRDGRPRIEPGDGHGVRG